MALLHDSPPPLVISGRIPFSTKVPGRGLPRYVKPFAVEFVPLTLDRFTKSYGIKHDMALTESIMFKNRE